MQSEKRERCLSNYARRCDCVVSGLRVSFSCAYMLCYLWHFVGRVSGEMQYAML